jgi:hypothetical protein
MEATDQRCSMADDLRDLVERAAGSPMASPADIERINRRAQLLRRRSVVRSVVGVTLAAALLVTAYLSLADTGQGSSVRIDPVSSLLHEPPRGAVSAQLLRDGTPVWVVHHDDNSVSVLSAPSTHTPYGVSQLVGWCPSSRSFEDGMYGSLWDERGHWRGGPAPSDLAHATVRVLDDDRIEVGPLIKTRVRTPPDAPVGEPCFGNRPRGYDPGSTRRHHFTSDEATSFGDLRRQTSDDASGDVVFLDDAVVVVTESGPARLCPAAKVREIGTCRDGIPIADFDTALLRKNSPGQTVVIQGDLLLRPGRNAVRELTSVDGYRITTQGAPK